MTRVAAGVCVGGLLTGSLAGAFAATKGKPDSQPVVIPLEPLGFASTSPRFVSTLATNFTLHFVDETHLLLTYTARTLLARLPDTREDDDDRNVAALLIELPSGKVLARTEWRTRDRDKFLWALGHGRFLLRVRSRLSLIDPVGNLAAGGPGRAFRQEDFLELQRPIGYVYISPEKDLLGIETVGPRKPRLKGIAADAAALAAAMGGTSDAGTPANVEIVGEPHTPAVQIHFYRLKMENADGTGRMTAQTAGQIGAPVLVDLPATGDGYLYLTRESPQTWDLDYVSHTGKRVELSAYETSCQPRAFFVSRSEFVAFGCRGGEDRPELSYFNMMGEQPWLSALVGKHVSPIVVAAPSAGRLAVSRTLLSANATDPTILTADDLASQEITVLQNYDGRQLLKVQASPIQRGGQNFDLSPEGMHFAVVRNGNIEVYPLPGLTGSDKKALAEARKMVPEPNDAPVKLNATAPAMLAPPVGSGANKQTGRAAQAASVPAPDPSGTAAALPVAESSQSAAGASGSTVVGPATSSEGQVGDTEGASRTRPSLYSKEFPKDTDDTGSPPVAKPQ